LVKISSPYFSNLTFLEPRVLKKFMQILALAVPLLLVGCNSGNSGTDGGGGTTVASYAGTYTGRSDGVNAGPTTIVIAADNSIKGTFSINNRLTNETGTGVPTVYESNLEGKVDSAGKVSINSFLEGSLVMIFSGQINSAGLLTGTYFEPAYPNDPSKAGTFSLQGPKNGTTTVTTGGSGGSAKSCTGSYVGTYDAPASREERIRLRNLSIVNNGGVVTGNDAIDNATAGGGGVDGGIYMAGSYAFETDANCNVVAGKTFVFYAYEYGISGSVAKSGSSTLIWSGQGSQGEMSVSVDSGNNISGQFFHPAPDSFVYGTINGKFTPNGKI
jgi:hypothetical protein